MESMESTRRPTSVDLVVLRPKTGFISVGGFGHYYLDYYSDDAERGA